MGSTAQLFPSSFSKQVRVSPLSRQTERDLAERAQQGEAEATHKLICSHLGSVIRIAQSYRNKGVPFEDLVEEGVLGLLEAVRRYDPERETKFLTYAVWWVRRAIIQSLAHSASLVRVPRYRSRQFKDAHKVAQDLASRLGRKARTHEVANKLGCSDQEAAQRLQSYPRSVSIDQPIDGWDRPISQSVEDPTAVNQEEHLIHDEMIAGLMECFEQLPEREQFVLTHRFGLEGRRIRTLKDLADEMGISKERVRQLEMQARNRIATNLRTLHKEDIL